MNKFYSLIITMLVLFGSIDMFAQDIPTGLVRLKSSRTSWYLAYDASSKAFTTASKNANTLGQVWIIEQSGSGYTIRNAECGSYLQSEGNYRTPSGGSTLLYVRKSSNVFHISADSNFGGKFLNTNTSHNIFSYSMDDGCNWAIEKVDNFTEEQVKQHFAELTGNVGELTDGKYYRIISYYGLVLTDGSDISTKNADDANFSQYWILHKDGDLWKIQNALSEKFITKNTQTSVPYHSNSQENVDRFNLDVSFKITPVDSKWDYKWTIASSGAKQGLHDSENQGHNVVLWSTDAAASVWFFQEAQVDEAALEKARAGEGAFDELVENKAIYQAHLDNLFEDKACTTLKADISALTDDALAANEDFADLTADMKAMVLKIKNNTWQQYTNGDYTADYERFFRIYDYQIYSNYSEMCNEDNFRMSNSFGRLSGPTGIVANPGDVIYVYVGAAAKTGCQIALEAVSTDGVAGNHPTGAVTSLRQGLNLFRFTEKKMLYIFHQLNNTSKKLADYPAITVHIEGGQLNGYWDATRGMTNADWVLLQKELLKASPFLNLKTKRLVFQMDADLVKQAEPKEMEGLMRIWDKIVENEDRYMGVEDFEGRYNNIWNAFSGASSYMHATTYGTWYSEGTISTVMNYAKMRSGGNIWGPSHEIGHNHQASINVIGTTESSNNLFSNINVFEQGITASRRDGPSELFNQLSKSTPWVQRDIWLTTSMYFQLYLYFHVQHHDDNFLPNLFRKMRKNPIDKSGSGAKDYLHLAKMICDVAKADLSEFFEAYGMFIPVSNVEVGDYATYYVTTTQTQITSAKKYMQKYEKKLGNIMFIDDRVITHPAIADNIFEAIPKGANRVPISDEDKNQFQMSSPNDKYVGGDYTLYTADATPSNDDYYVLTNSKKTIEFKGTNYAGHKFYDGDGNLIWATNAKKVSLPKCVTSIGMDNVRVVTANYNMTDTECTTTKPDLSAVRDIVTGQVLTDKEVYDLTGRRVTNVKRTGMYIVNGKKVFVK